MEEQILSEIKQYNLVDRWIQSEVLQQNLTIFTITPSGCYEEK